MKLHFGKHKGRTIQEVARMDKGDEYLRWLRDNTDVKHPDYGQKNQQLVEEINWVLAGNRKEAENAQNSHPNGRTAKEMSNHLNKAITGESAALLHETLKLLLVEVREIKQMLSIKLSYDKPQQVNAVGKKYVPPSEDFDAPTAQDFDIAAEINNAFDSLD